MTDWKIRLPDGRIVTLSRHALDRWQEYVCPGRARMYAAQFLEHVLSLEAELVREPPDWLTYTADPDGPGELFLVTGDFALAMPLDEQGEPHVVATVIARGGLVPARREYRDQQRRGRRAYRRGQIHQGKNEARRGDRRRRRDRQAPSIDTDL